MEKGRARAAKRRKLKLDYRVSKYAYRRPPARPPTVYVTVNRERVSLNEVLKLQFYREMKTLIPSRSNDLR